MTTSLLLVIAGIVVLIWAGLKYATPRGSPILPDDPLWAAAIGRARATIPEMLDHHKAGREVWVKYSVEVPSGMKEHVWGRITAVRGDTLECVIETPPASLASTVDLGMTILPSTQIEDWQVELEDGRIRGGYTTKAQAEIARRDGHTVPAHVEDMIRRMAE
jgi:hypothetical protein